MLKEQLKRWLRRLLRSSGRRSVYYVGGSEGLPPPLSPQETQGCLDRLREGDTTVRPILIERNLRLVVYVAKRFENTGVGLEDLISIGTIGLIKAVDTFSPDKGSLSGYASRCIENEIRMSLRTEKKLVGEVSMDEPMGQDREGNERTVLDLVGTDAEEIFEEVRKRLEGKRLRAFMDRTLKPREKLVLSLRYGMDGAAPLTQQQVADRIGISRSYISRLEKKAILKLRMALSETEEEADAGLGKKDL